VCSPAHHLAATKALDAAFDTEPTVTAKKIRELMYNGYMVYDHILHFFYLGGPDFVVGPTEDKSKRNILGVIEKVGEDFALEVIKHRAYGQKIIEITSGKPISPVCGIPGGVNKSLNEDDVAEIKQMGESSIEFTKKSLAYFEDLVLKNEEYMKLVTSPAYTLACYDMGLVDDDNLLNFYDGMIRVTDPDGKEAFKFPASEYLDYVGEKVVPWSYVKLPYLKKIGWKGLEGGKDSGVYRVGPLARLNAAEGISTPLAQAEMEKFFSALGGKPVHNTLAFHWARLIELMHAAEMVVKLADDPDVLGTELRNPIGTPGEGVGVIEAARGTLYHHYKINDDRLIEKANLIVATTNNKIPINISIRDAAKGLIHGENVEEGTLNMVEMAFRAYDPCFACASHAIDGGTAIEIRIFNKQGELVKEHRNF
jgi:F420-non-reducing hydrogenase large subunit